MKTQSLPAQFADREASSDQLIVWAKQACAKIGAWARACADNYAAAGLYGQLSGFSDTELKHRGLSRDTLARDVTDLVERPHKAPTFKRSSQSGGLHPERAARYVLRTTGVLTGVVRVVARDTYGKGLGVGAPGPFPRAARR